jgi:hypothetical protein
MTRRQQGDNKATTFSTVSMALLRRVSCWRNRKRLTVISPGKTIGTCWKDGAN